MFHILGMRSLLKKFNFLAWSLESHTRLRMSRVSSETSLMCTPARVNSHSHIRWSELNGDARKYMVWSSEAEQKHKEIQKYSRLRHFYVYHWSFKNGMRYHKIWRVIHLNIHEPEIIACCYIITCSSFEAYSLIIY